MEIRSYSRYILVVLCIAVVFTALVLVALSAWMRQPEGNFVGAGDADLTEAYRHGYSAARERYQKMGVITVDTETKTMNGTVVEAGSKSLIVEQTSLDTDPLADNVPDERRITLAANAKVYKETRKSDEQFNREQAEFQRALVSNSDIAPPTASTRQEIKLSDIPVSANVRITSAEPVRLARDIVATEVVYMVSAP